MADRTQSLERSLLQKMEDVISESLSAADRASLTLGVVLDDLRGCRDCCGDCATKYAHAVAYLEGF